MLQTNNNNVAPDSFTFPFLLIACANGPLEVEGKQIHSWVIKNAFSLSNAHVQTALIRFYTNCKALDDARKVFDEITDIDVIQCNVLMSGHLQCGLPKDALSIFQDMTGRGVSTDEYCVITALAACANLGAFEQGKWIHEHVTKTEWVESDVFIGSAFVDMYSKCGCIQMASEVFESMPMRNKHLWATMIRGFAVHGRPELAISFLTACAHAGLQKEGQVLLDKMESLHGVAPEHEHFSCVVDFVCRAGQLDDALKLIRSMPMNPRASVLGRIVEWRMIGDRGLRKTPGYSAIEIDGMVNEFVSGDVSHPCLADIHEHHEILVQPLLFLKFFVQRHESDRILPPSSCFPTDHWKAWNLGQVNQYGLLESSNDIVLH
ncbi:hypothetical protein RND71_032908 [Anisodus tanguticus]|uniref:Pentatricopeptide repeat-containing protein n=1 Tax=Anisodus tanguticus TaxID=243964 RepID=A0AAE1V2Q0_9SOLA|nr:hypothetical protein RND71_032908 [Anisodus tanguticus]